MFKVVRTSDYTSQDLERIYHTMSVSRRNHIDKLKLKQDKIRSLVGELLARELVSDFSRIPENDVSIDIGSNGKPFVAEQNVHLNISHSGDFVACVVSNNPVGIDIEINRKVNLAVAKKVCSQSELDFVLDSEISSEESANRLLQIWTYKEAFVKMKGCGLKGLDSVPEFFTSSKELLTTPEYTLCITEEK